MISKWCWRDWAVCGVISVCVLWILWPFQENHREPPGRSQCLSNLKQTATATSIYMSDHEERMPLANWMASMIPYIKGREIMECPLVLKDSKHFG